VEVVLGALEQNLDLFGSAATQHAH
jgi:hypothetical protein